jgi:hypothetical protein
MLNETSGLPPVVLATHPGLMMWEEILFGTTASPLPTTAATAAPTGNNGVEAARGEAAVSVALMDAPVSANICTEATTATEATTVTKMATNATKMATTMTATATGHPPLVSPPPPARWHLVRMGAREGKRPKGGG